MWYLYGALSMLMLLCALQLWRNHRGEIGRQHTDRRTLLPLQSMYDFTSPTPDQ